MGLYDGVATRGQTGIWLQRRNGPAHGLARGAGHRCGRAGAIGGGDGLGFKNYAPDLPFAGVILNRVASPRHERLTRLGMERAGLPVLGVLPRRGDLTLPERHLGLIQAVEHPDLEAAIAGYADFLRAHVDLDTIRAAAASATPPAKRAPCPNRRRSASRWRVMRRFPLPIRIC